MIDMTDVNLRPSREIRLNDLHVRGKGNGNLRISSHVFRDLLSFMYNYIFYESIILFGTFSLKNEIKCEFPESV